MSDIIDPSSIGKTRHLIAVPKREILERDLNGLVDYEDLKKNAYSDLFSFEGSKGIYSARPDYCPPEYNGGNLSLFVFLNQLTSRIGSLEQKFDINSYNFNWLDEDQTLLPGFDLITINGGSNARVTKAKEGLANALVELGWRIYFPDKPIMRIEVDSNRVANQKIKILDPYEIMGIVQDKFQYSIVNPPFTKLNGNGHSASKTFKS